MYKYVCIHCGNVNTSEFRIEDLMANFFDVRCSFCGSGFFDLFDFNDDTKNAFCSDDFKERSLSIGRIVEINFKNKL